MEEKLFEQGRPEQRIPIDIPMPRFSLKSHPRNIDYAIEQIRKYGGNYVIGYRLVRGWGTREMFHEAIPLTQAEKLKKSKAGYEYSALDDLLSRKKDIEDGRYTLGDTGLVMGLNPLYSQ